MKESGFLSAHNGQTTCNVTVPQAFSFVPFLSVVQHTHRDVFQRMSFIDPKVSIFSLSEHFARPSSSPN